MVRCLRKYELIHSNYLLLVDEVRSNFYCNYDNNVSKEKYILRVSNGYTIIKSNNNDYRFSVLRFISTDRQPVMYVAIIKAERLSYEQMQGIGIKMPLVEHSNLIEELNQNSSLRKRYPDGPVCTFRSKVVPCIVTCSPSRDINQKIFMEYLKKMNELGIYNRLVTKLCILLDGYGSRFGLDFLEYVRNDVLYSTAKWQVSDSYH